jgi:hypothetical protein
MIRQPWHTEYCHLEFEYSDLPANYTTQDMLTLSKIYAVKTGHPHVYFSPDGYRDTISDFGFMIRATVTPIELLLRLASPKRLREGTVAITSSSLSLIIY